MKSFRGPKAKVVRRFGENIFESNKYDAILRKRNTPPGVHGNKKRNSKVSEYGKQLLEKQKIKFMYGMTERQFRNLYNKAVKKKGPTGINLLQMLETRIDNFVFRSGWASTRAQARQLVNHSHVTVNGVIANIPSMSIKAGDLIEMRKKNNSRNLINLYIEENQWRSVPSWINSDTGASITKMIKDPEKDEMPKNLNEQLVVELYSK